MHSDFFVTYHMILFICFKEDILIKSSNDLTCILSMCFTCSKDDYVFFLEELFEKGTGRDGNDLRWAWDCFFWEILRWFWNGLVSEVCESL